ncbi:MAG TPA: glycosyltransferase family 87 protein [Blastocatellia bacterium]|jgi:alpha-1,2-mannosyltransferase|nr:glycosyltransferase family 87 protein [Blastocatellia bacterium]
MRKRSFNLLLIAASAVALLCGLYYAGRSSADPRVYGNDFNVYYFAAREIIAGRDPYQSSLGPWTPYLYLPLLAELLAPVALLPVRVAAFFWYLLNLSSLAVAARLLVRLAEPEEEEGRDNARLSSSGRALVAVAAIAVVARFILDNLQLGQINLLVTMLAIAHVYLYSRGRKLASALALALAASFKVTPLVFLLYHLARGRAKYAAGCFALFAVITVASFLPFGARGLSAFNDFTNRTLRNGQGFDLTYPGNQSMRGAIGRFLREGSARSPSTPVSFAASILVLALALFASRRASAEIAAAAPLFCCLVLLSPLSWKAHFVGLMFPAAYLAREVLTGTDVRRMRLILGVLAAAFCLFNLTGPLIAGRSASESADSASLIWAGAMLIFSCSVGAILSPSAGFAGQDGPPG